MTNQTVKKNIKIISLAIRVLFTVYIGVRLFPSLLFKGETQYKNTTIFSNEPVDIGYILDKSYQRVQQSAISDHDISLSVFFCDTYWKYLFFNPMSSGSFGVSYPVINHIIIAKTDFQSGAVISRRENNNIRTLESLLTHEIAHRYVEAEFGLLKTRLMPGWKEEGYCEYIAQASSHNAVKGMQIFLADSTDESMSFRYFKYRL